MGGWAKWTRGLRRTLVGMSPGCYTKGMNHWILLLKSLLRCMLTNLDVNEKIKIINNLKNNNLHKEVQGRLAGSLEHTILDLGVVSLSPTLGHRDHLRKLKKN